MIEKQYARRQIMRDFSESFRKRNRSGKGFLATSTEA